VGTAMLVWDGGQSDTIGGGALEYETTKAARNMLAGGPARHLARVPLGPAMGQCCGGAVTLLTEVFDAAVVASLPGDVIARPAEGHPDMPLAVRQVLNMARNSGRLPEAQFLHGWMVEPMEPVAAPLWIFGAGHVGRALVDVLSPLPDFAITWVDSDAARFPTEIPESVERLIAANPADVVAYAPDAAHHLILTYSHALDLELCHRLLGRGFASAGLIGSATKWARFRKRLVQLGHSDAQISRICCPIGQPALGKHPQAIAVGVAAALLSQQNTQETARDATG
ncbi:MAG: xanthine dehydrogenase accessory protein XdhC, partial [Paracoccaceae bacterium]